MGQFVKNCSEDKALYQLFTSEQNVLNKYLSYLNIDGVVLWCNKRVIQDFKQNIINKTPKEIFSKESANKCEKDNLEVIESKNNSYIIESLKFKTGEERNVFTIKTPWIIGQGQVAGIFISSIDFGQFEEEPINNNYKNQYIQQKLVSKLYALCFDMQPLLKEILVNINDKHSEIGNFAKKLLLSSEKILTKNRINNSEQVPTIYQTIDLNNLIKKIIFKETNAIKCSNFRFIYTKIDKNSEIIISDFFRIKKSLEIIIKNLLKSASRSIEQNIICKITLMHYKNDNVFITFETKSYLFNDWFLTEQKLEHKLSVMSEFSNGKGDVLGLNLIKTLITELNGNIELVDCSNQTTKMVINVPL